MTGHLENNAQEFWRGLGQAMSLAVSVGLAVFGMVAVGMTGLAISTGATLIAGLVPATPLIMTGAALGGLGLMWGGLKNVRAAMGPASGGSSPVSVVSSSADVSSPPALSLSQAPGVPLRLRFDALSSTPRHCGAIGTPRLGRNRCPTPWA